MIYVECKGFSHEYFVDTSDMNTAKPIEIKCKNPANFQFNVQIIVRQHNEMTIFYGTISEILLPGAIAQLQVGSSR